MGTNVAAGGDRGGGGSRWPRRVLRAEGPVEAWTWGVNPRAGGFRVTLYFEPNWMFTDRLFITMNLPYKFCSSGWTALCSSSTGDL